jgi:hypothetical protein
MQIDAHDSLECRNSDIAERLRAHETDIVDDAIDPGVPDDCREPAAGGRIAEVGLGRPRSGWLGW